MIKYLQIFSLVLLTACSTSRPEIDVACEIDDNYNYILKWDLYPRLDGDVKIYRSINPDFFDTKSAPACICNINDNQVRIPDNGDLHRYYFLLRFDNKFDVVTGPRAERLKYVQNFRDIGGYKGKDNKHIRWGMIYRSGNLDSLDEMSVERLKLMGIRTLIDFRDSEDVQKPSGKLNLENVINLPGSLHYREALRTRIMNNEILKGDATVFMQDLNVALSACGKSAFKSMFNQLLVEDNYPVILSCSYGKDYTGFAVALLLAALGVQKDDIVSDYVLTNSYFDKQTVRSIDIKECNTKSQEALTKILTADPMYLTFVYSRLEKEYGSISNYLEKELGLTTEKRKHLKQILLK